MIHFAQTIYLSSRRSTTRSRHHTSLDRYPTDRQPRSERPSRQVHDIYTRGTEEGKSFLTQAPALLDSHHMGIITPMRTRMHCTSNTTERVILARDIMLCAVAFRTTKRWDELIRTLIQRILRLPNENGLLFNFQQGKSMRDEADHLLSIHTITSRWRYARFAHSNNTSRSKQQQGGT